MHEYEVYFDTAAGVRVLGMEHEGYTEEQIESVHDTVEHKVAQLGYMGQNEGVIGTVLVPEPMYIDMFDTVYVSIDTV